VPSIDYLDRVDLLEIGMSIIPNFQVRDMGLLESAAARPQTTIFGKDAYETLEAKAAALLHALAFEAKAAALLHALARNHPLIDGNKRLAWSATRVFCLINGYDIRYSVVEAELLVVGTAQGNFEVNEIVEFLHIYKV